MKADATCKYCGAKLFLGKSKDITPNLRRSALYLFEKGHSKCVEGVQFFVWPVKKITLEEARELYPKKEEEGGSG